MSIDKSCEIIRILQDADMVLVGIGEEFEDYRLIKSEPAYEAVRERLESGGASWAVPLWNSYLLRACGSAIPDALERLAGIMAHKNYFVVSTVTNDCISQSSLNQERVVSPCGGILKKQCKKGCSGGLGDCAADETKLLNRWMEQERRAWREGITRGITVPELGRCLDCGQSLILNNVYTTDYDEKGYLDQWKRYTQWLQGTLNRRLCILELGVGMECPSVIRWPFEKAAYFNQKAVLVRVNKRLYQLSEELGGRGISVPENAADWLLQKV